MLNLPSVVEQRKEFFKEFVESFKSPEKQGEELKEEKVNLKTKSVLIYDFGLMTEAAVRMARDFSKVYYYVPWESAFPKSDNALVGEGLEGVERIGSFWDYVDRADLICFFDTYTGDKVEYLRNKGYRVWGAGKSEILENNRWKGRKIQQAVGLPTQPTENIKGIENLIEFLKRNSKKWIKINTFRGDIETFFHDTYDETEAQFLGKLLQDAGAKSKTMEFVVEDDIKDAVEPGYDGWVIDGQFPSMAMYGYERKGIGYIGRVSTYENLPESIKNVNNKLSQVFEKLGGRTLFSTEIKVDKNKVGYLIDLTIRAPMPVPSAVHLEIWSNFSEIIWYGAEGILIEPKTNAVYAAGVNMESDWAEHNWTFIDFPKEIRQWVKLRRAFKTQDEKFYALPNFKSIGTVIGLGNTIQEAVDKVKARIVKIKAKEINYSVSGLEEIMNDIIPKGRKVGIKF